MSSINQQTIADRLGLSRATVSRCFTNHAGINPVTRAKVFHLAAEIGYTHMPSRATSAKRKKAETVFSVLICSDHDEYFQGGYQSPGKQILEGVSEYAQRHDVRVDVNLISPSVSDIEESDFTKIESLKARRSTGVLLIYPFPANIVAQLALQFPLVSLVDQSEHQSIDCVDVDHNGGISGVIDHLFAAGHRRIGFYTRQYPNQASWSHRRHGAFLEKMARMKLPVSPDDVIGVFPSKALSVPENFGDAIARTRDGVTAWVCAADHQAYDLIQSFESDGLQVPGDVSVAGFDGIERSSTDPNLTTVQIPFRAIGGTGAERLAARLEKRFSDRQHVYIAGEIRPGTTVGAPATNGKPQFLGKHRCRKPAKLSGLPEVMTIPLTASSASASTTQASNSSHPSRLRTFMDFVSTSQVMVAMPSASLLSVKSVIGLSQANGEKMDEVEITRRRLCL